MDIGKYLKRIKIEHIEEATLDYLKRLHKNHLFNIPFENQELYTYNMCTIDNDKLYEKIIIKNEGGVCYQLNFLFSELLKELGFEVTILSAKVKETYYDHMLLKVKVGKSYYLCDVGYGLNFLEPIPFKTDKDLKDPRGIFNITEENNEYTLFAHFYHKLEYLVQYSFYDEEKEINQFLPRMIYYSTNPNSSFLKDLTVILESTRTRKVIKNNTLKVGLDNPIITSFHNENIKKITRNFIGLKIDNLTIIQLKTKAKD